MLVQLKNDAGLVKQVIVGFSWTAFFFGCWPFLFRGQTGKFFLWAFIGLFTLSLSNIYLWFRINKISAHAWMENGFKPIGEGWNVAASKWDVSLYNIQHPAPAVVQQQLPN